MIRHSHDVHVFRCAASSLQVQTNSSSKNMFFNYSVPDGEYCLPPVLAELTPPGPTNKNLLRDTQFEVSKFAFYLGP